MKKEGRFSRFEQNLQIKILVFFFSWNYLCSGDISIYKLRSVGLCRYVRSRIQRWYTE